MKISVAIPTYECGGKGWLYTSELLNSIWKQDYLDYEVVISDQSEDEDIKNVVSFYNSKMDIKYLDSRHLERSISPNANNAIKNCSGDVIKIMFGDDFFVSESALTLISQNIGSNGWLVNSCCHAQNIHSPYRPFNPSYNDKIHHGINTISCPSSLTMTGRRYFDENLSHLADVELYKRLHDEYGLPSYLHEIITCNREHPNQVQRSNDYEEEFNKELEYVKTKYGETDG